MPLQVRHLATFNLWRNADNSLGVTIAEARGVNDELGESGAPLHLCAMNALRAAVAGDTVDKAEAWDAAVAVPPKVQREIDEHRSLWIRTILATCSGTDRQRQSFSDGYNHFPLAPRASAQMRENHALGRTVSELLNPERSAA